MFVYVILLGNGVEVRLTFENKMRPDSLADFCFKEN